MSCLSSNSHIHLAVSVFFYIFPQSFCLFCCRKVCGPIHECINWDWGRAIPFLGVHKWDFRCSVTNLNYKCISQATCSLHDLLLLRPLPRPLPLSTFPIRKTPFANIFLLCGICATMEEQSRRHYFVFWIIFLAQLRYISRARKWKWIFVLFKHIFLEIC